MAGLKSRRGTSNTERLDPLGLDAGRVRLSTLVGIRWIAVGGQLTTLIVIHYGLGFSLPMLEAGLAVAASALLNLALVARRSATRQLSDRDAALQLGFDLFQLAFLLYLTGGLTNPFSILILVPVTISATVLSRRSTLALLGLGLGLSIGLAAWHRSLPWHGGETLSLPQTYLIGLGVSLAVSMVFLTLYAERVSAEARRRALALAATKAALDREQKLAELGTLAAAAAHELGTPLGTITLAARELLKETGQDDPHHEDIALISEQANRCRRILERLSEQRIDEDEHPFSHQRLSAIAREVARPFESLSDVTVTVETADHTDGPSEPVIRRRPEILHGLNNFIENAVDFAHRRVTVTVDWSAKDIDITIRDDGPGFDGAILRSLGEPYVTTRRSKGGRTGGVEEESGLGLGVFIAKTLLERTGATVIFDNAEKGGAIVHIHWSQAALAETAGTNA